MRTITNTLYLISACALMLSSCRQQEATDVFRDVSDRRIVFNTFLPDLETKAAEIASDLTYLRLTAYNVSDPSRIENGQLTEYFNNEKLEKAAGSEKFVSGACVWPEAGREDDLLHFFSYYPELPVSASLANNTAVNADKEVTLGYQVRNFSIAQIVDNETDIAEHADFVTAYAKGTMNEKVFAGIDLNFRHQLSRIEVKAKGSHKSCDIEIAGVSIGNVMLQGSFDFQTSEDTDGVWTETSKGKATYIFREGDAIVTVGAEPVSIMGAKINEKNDNCALVIPSATAAWAYGTDALNEQKGLYLNVLLRILDKTPGGNGKQQYPYFDNSQGLNALNVPVILLAVDNDGKVSANYGPLYKGDGKYFTDQEKKKEFEFSVPAGSTVKEFGWAALPINGDWKPGYIYTYTLDYTYGIGVHGPETPGDVSPKAGDPVISDRVGVSLGFRDWQNGGTTGITVPGN